MSETYSRRATQYEAELIAAGDQLAQDLEALKRIEQERSWSTALDETNVAEHIATWKAVRRQWDTTAWRGPDCTCSEYGHGLNLTRVVSASCPVHSRAANGQSRPE